MSRKVNAIAIRLGVSRWWDDRMPPVIANQLTVKRAQQQDIIKKIIKGMMTKAGLWASEPIIKKKVGEDCQIVISSLKPFKIKSRVATYQPPFKGVLKGELKGEFASLPPHAIRGALENGNKHMHNLPSGKGKVRPVGVVGRSGGVTRRGRKFTLRGFKRNYILCYMREMIETYTQENFRIYHIQNRIMHMTADQIGLNIERSKGSILAIMKRISRGGQRSRAKRYTQRRFTRSVFPQRPPLR